MKIISLIFLIFSTLVFALEPFVAKSHNVAKLFTEAKENIKDKNYDKALEKLEICKQTKRCSAKLVEIYTTVPELKNMTKAESYVHLEYGFGNDKAYHNFALLYYKDGNIDKAKEFFIKSGEAKVYESLFNLGKIYEVEGDLIKAVQYYKTASDNNISEADYSLGIYYYNKKDYNKSLKYLKKSLKQGYAPASKTVKALEKYINNKNS